MKEKSTKAQKKSSAKKIDKKQIIKQEKLVEQDFYPATAKEDRDILLVYKSIDLQKLNKINILGVNINAYTRDELMAVSLKLVEEKQKSNLILFVDPIKLMYLRKNKTGQKALHSASLIIPEGGGIRWAAKRLKLEFNEKVSTVSYIMDLIRLAEKEELTVFILGGKDEIIEKTSYNLERSFPRLRIVGRHSGFFSKEREQMVKEAIRKTNPDILIIGMGFSSELKWILENQEFFGKSLVISAGNSLDVLSGIHKKAPDFFQLRGLTWFWRMISRPWRIIRFFRMIKYFLLVIYYAYFKKKT